LRVLFKDAREIALGERDAERKLGVDTWPGASDDPGSWQPRPEDGLFEREVVNGENETALAAPLHERVLRFPSAPIHGLHRLGQDQVNMGPVENFHTLRLLSHPKLTPKTPSRIFLMHNGLNETRKMGLYYELASHLIAQDEHTVCLVRPFPGHLTRCPYSGLSETPLDHYLWDGLHLFRQFLRYMIETRWLLSTIVRYPTYRCVSGSGLLVERNEPEGSRLDAQCLTEAMMGEWENLYGASVNAIEERRNGSPKMCDPPNEAAFEQAIESLRGALGLLRHYDSEDFRVDAEPELHAIGYSLGGFTAQSVFMSWPFLLSSCSTLLSGGAMRELAPTAFADPEEWQTVLHSLRYELDDAMMDWRFQQIDDKALEVENDSSHPGAEGKFEARGWGAGIDPYLFLYLKRTFYEVFEQEYRGSFQSRLVAFRQRMLFVVGGNDPIVPPKSVLDSSPPDGINMLTIGGLGHFLGDSPRGEVEKEQRAFWIPEIARTAGLLANEAAKKHRQILAETWLDSNYLVPKPSRSELEKKKKDKRLRGSLTVAERLEVERDGTLPSMLFQRSLDDLLARVTTTSSGLLFILRNEAPTFLLGERALQQHAAALYHSDVDIVRYIENVRTRRALIHSKGVRDRVWVMLPWNVETIIRGIDARLQHPSQSESSGEQTSGPWEADQLWNELRGQGSRWANTPKRGRHRESLRVFHAPNGVEDAKGVRREEIGKLLQAARHWLGLDNTQGLVRPSLPDCWIWMSNEFFDGKESTPNVEAVRRVLYEEVPNYIFRGKDPKRGERVERKIATALQNDHLRIVSVSRARYNPRYRGKIIATPRQAQELLLQATLCIAASQPFTDFFERADAELSNA
jgi:hypothetical protein